MYHEDPYDSSRRAGGLRASDAEREQTADALRRSHTEGRLTDTEFEQRLARCYQARTAAELDALTSDLSRGGLSPWPEGWSPVRAGRLPIPLMIIGAILGLLVLHGLVGVATMGAHPPLLFGLFVITGLVWLGSRRRRRAAR